MFRFTLKFFLLFTILFLGVLLGMQQANEGIREMKGYDDPNFHGAFRITEDQSGELEAAILGKKVTSHDIRVKQEKLEKMEAFNFFSTLGGKFADGVSILFQKLLDLLSAIFISIQPVIPSQASVFSMTEREHNVVLIESSYRYCYNQF